MLNKLLDTNAIEPVLEECLALSTIGFAAVNNDGVIAYANSVFCKMLAIKGPEAAVGCSLLDHVGERFQSSVAGLIQVLNSPEAANIELRLDRDAEALSLHIASVGLGLRMLVADRLLKPAINTAFPNSISYGDPLTGLGNRLLLDQEISNWRPREPEAVSLAVIMINLDRFKQINDFLGHESGDRLLKLAAMRIKSAARSHDLVIRVAGDQFVVLHSIGLQPVGAESVAKRIVEVISRPFLIDGQQVNIGASIGIAALNHGTNKTIDLLKHAELALYEAKAAGFGSVKIFDPALVQLATERYQLEIDLRRALVLKEFTLVYQPQVKISNGALQGFEALIRWHHPTRGMVSPANFIPLAEETGEIHAIGEWTLRTACKEALNWDGDYTVSVNVSPIQFENEKLIDIVRNTLATTGLPPSRLELEITEGVLMKNPEHAQKILWAIKSMGVGIAMDDFGTGYSSLSYLNSFPFSKLKIDQSFVRVENSAKSRALVQAIIKLGENLDMKTIAEGVETEEQFNELALSGCMEVQGYLISRPIAAKAIAEFISTNRTNSNSNSKGGQG